MCRRDEIRVSIKREHLGACCGSVGHHGMNKESVYIQTQTWRN